MKLSTDKKRLSSIKMKKPTLSRGILEEDFLSVIPIHNLQKNSKVSPADGLTVILSDHLKLRPGIEHVSVQLNLFEGTFQDALLTELPRPH